MANEEDRGRYNRKTLLAACEALLARDDVQIRLRMIAEANTTAQFTGKVDEDGNVHDIVITLDPAQGGLIECALHEALHIVLNEQIGEEFNSALEETIVKALEVDLFKKAIHRGNVKRWRRLISNKLRDS